MMGLVVKWRRGWKELGTEFVAVAFWRKGDGAHVALWEDFGAFVLALVCHLVSWVVKGNGEGGVLSAILAEAREARDVSARAMVARRIVVFD